MGFHATDRDDPAWKDRDILLAEIERLRALLRETIPFINDAGDDEDPDAQSRANDLFVRIASALEQEA